MAGINYVKLAATAKALLKSNGTTAQLGDGVTLRPVQAVRNKNITNLFEHSDIEIGDVEFLLEGGANPQRTERFTFGTDSFVLMAQPKPVAPAGINVIWYVWGRVG